MKENFIYHMIHDTFCRSRRVLTGNHRSRLANFVSQLRLLENGLEGLNKFASFGKFMEWKKFRSPYNPSLE